MNSQNNRFDLPIWLRKRTGGGSAISGGGSAIAEPTDYRIIEAEANENIDKGVFVSLAFNGKAYKATPTDTNFVIGVCVEDVLSGDVARIQIYGEFDYDLNLFSMNNNCFLSKDSRNITQNRNKIDDTFIKFVLLGVPTTLKKIKLNIKNYILIN